MRQFAKCGKKASYFASELSQFRGDMRTPTNEKFNNFGVLRLVFAALVIISHSPELVDGNRSRELLTRLFGTLSFGEVAVDGFFLVSGYLITKSFAERPDWYSYVTKRVLRIFPGYTIAFWVCIIIIAPLAGHSGSSFRNFSHNLLRNITLSQPDIPDVFNGMPFPALNGAMWTIPYEFRCYLAVLVGGLLVRRLGDDLAWSLRWAVAVIVLSGLCGKWRGKWHREIVRYPSFLQRCPLFLRVWGWSTVLPVPA